MAGQDSFSTLLVDDYIISVRVRFAVGYVASSHVGELITVLRRQHGVAQEDARVVKKLVLVAALKSLLNAR